MATHQVPGCVPHEFRALQCGVQHGGAIRVVDGMSPRLNERVQDLMAK
jgi:hypothetical protein